MSIYPDKKDGKLTGRFAVEVTIDGKRKRGRTDSLPEAKALEAKFEKELKGGEVEVPRNIARTAPTTLRDYLRRVQSQSGKTAPTARMPAAR